MDMFGNKNDTAQVKNWTRGFGTIVRDGIARVGGGIRANILVEILNGRMRLRL
jgi:hypothetical protein